MATYKRILLKLSGESLMGEKQYGIDEKRLAEYAAQIKGSYPCPRSPAQCGRRRGRHPSQSGTTGWKIGRAHV